MIARRTKTKPESDLSYTDKFLGKRLRFSVKGDEIVATLKAQADEKEARAALARLRLTVSGLDAEHACAVVRVPPGQGLVAAGRTLAGSPQIANTLPALTDNEGATRYFVPDEFTVQFADGVTRRTAEQVIRSSGCPILIRHRTRGYYTLGVPDGRGMFEMLRAFSARREVAFAEPGEVGTIRLTYVPDDDDFGLQWALRNTGQAIFGLSGNPGADISATGAWDFTRGDPDVVVAVIDTGADLDHPDLAPNILPRDEEDWDFSDRPGTSPDDTSTDGHGTHVCGIVAAVDNAVGSIGVAHLCRVMPLRIKVGFKPFYNAVDAINYVADQAGVHRDRRYVVNVSFGVHPALAGLHRAVKRAVEANVVVVAAVGNDGKSRSDKPAAYPETIAVAATDSSDKKAFFSNYGDKVDVCAPGANIWSTIPDNTHTLLHGTSQAAPHVSGLAALIWSLDPSLTSQEVRTVIESTCDNIDALNPDFAGQLGHGRINAFRALASIAFRLGVGPNPLRLAPGSTGVATVDIIRAPGAAGLQVSLALPSSPPPGVTVSLDPAPTAGDSRTMAFALSGNVQPGTYTLTVVGTAAGVQKTASLTLQVRTFVIALSQPFVALEAGGASVNVTVSITRAPGFTADVVLTVEGLPQVTPQGGGVSAVFQPATVHGNTSTLTLHAGRMAPGDFEITLRGTSGTLVQTIPLSVEVFGTFGEP